MEIPSRDQGALPLGVRTPFRAFVALCAFAGCAR